MSSFSTFISLALLIVSIVVKAQNVESFFEQFRQHKNVVLVDVPKELLSLGLQVMGSKKGKQWADKIERLRILSFDDASRSVRRKFKKAVKAFNWREYSEVIKEKTKYSETRIMTQGTDDIIRRLVICTTDEDDSALIIIDGAISSNDIDSVLEEAKDL